jgi:hypothetical protein
MAVVPSTVLSASPVEGATIPAVISVATEMLCDRFEIQGLD